MRPIFTFALIGCTVAVIAATALRANDSVAEAAAGGLVLKQTRDIDMVSEDLYVSADEIRVRYVFRNRAPRDISVTVAFPLPDRDLSQLEYGDIAWPGDFVTRVDGRSVRMTHRRRAVRGGVDHTALLEGLGVPIGVGEVGAASEAIERLRPQDQQRLVRAGLANPVGEGPNRAFEAQWTVTEAYHWEQVFPAGRDLIVEHRYRPGTGGSAGTGFGHAEYLASDFGRGQIARYCIDQPFLAAIDRLARRSGGEGYLPMTEQWISYVLTTGANWRSPIGDFRLVVDKGDPRNLVSFCGEGVRRISPTQFEMRRRNWRPTRDLHVLILRPYSSE